MDQQYSKQVEKLFEPKLQIERLEPIDYDISERKTVPIDGISSFLSKLDSYSEKYPGENVQNAMVTYIDRLEARNISEKREMEKKLIAWNPDKDPQIIGDPFKTLFVFKLAYDVNEIDLTNTFSAFGEIEHVRIVRVAKGSELKGEGNSRGYGFIVFKNENSVRRAYYDANGIDIKGRKVLVDTERGRSVKNWKPRRLGGGLGGRAPVSKASVVKPMSQKAKVPGALRSRGRPSQISASSPYHNPYHSKDSNSQGTFRPRSETASSGYGGREYHRDRVQRDRYGSRSRYGESGTSHYNGYYRGRRGYGSTDHY